MFDLGVLGRSVVALGIGLVRPGFEGSNLSVYPHQEDSCGRKRTHFTPSARHSLFFMDLKEHQAHRLDRVGSTMQSLLLATHCREEELVCLPRYMHSYWDTGIESCGVRDTYETTRLTR